MTLTTLKRAASAVENPPAGEATIFVDSADNAIKAKLQDGTLVDPGAGGSGSGGDALTPVAWALLTLADGVEAVTTQVGDVITGVNVVGVGEYDVTLDPSAGLTSPFQLGVQLTCGGTDRFATFLVDLPSNKITVLVRNHAGTAVAAAYVTMALWYVPEAP